MTATFPNGIASFTAKKDNVDTNYANDINRLQDEVVAIEQTLGVLMNVLTDLSVEVTTDEESVAAYEIQTTTKFKNLADRLTYIHNGYHIRAAELRGSNYLIKPSNINSDVPTQLPMDKPSAAADPFGLYNGRGLTLTKAGFWLIHGFVHFDVGDTRPYGGKGDNANWNALNRGTFQASIDDGTNWNLGADRRAVVADNGYYPDMFLSPIRTGWFKAGTRIKLRAGHDSGQNQRISNARLSAVWFRSPPAS